MPCTYTGSFEGDEALAAKEALEKNRSTLTEVTALLCSACKILEKKKAMTPQLRAWYAEHEKVDRKRLKKGVAPRD